MGRPMQSGDEFPQDYSYQRRFLSAIDKPSLHKFTKDRLNWLATLTPETLSAPYKPFVPRTPADPLHSVYTYSSVAPELAVSRAEVLLQMRQQKLDERFDDTATAEDLLSWLGDSDVEWARLTNTSRAYSYRRALPLRWYQRMIKTPRWAHEISIGAGAFKVRQIWYFLDMRIDPIRANLNLASCLPLE